MLNWFQDTGPADSRSLWDLTFELAFFALSPDARERLVERLAAEESAFCRLPESDQRFVLDSFRGLSRPLPRPAPESRLALLGLAVKTRSFTRPARRSLEGLHDFRRAVEKSWGDLNEAILRCLDQGSSAESWRELARVAGVEESGGGSP
jgi:hypothetical protein